MISPGADVILYIDPDLSLIDVTSPSDSQSFAVSGGGSASSSPDQFLTALLWAEDGELGLVAILVSTGGSDELLNVELLTGQVVQDWQGAFPSFDAAPRPLPEDGGVERIAGWPVGPGAATLWYDLGVGVATRRLIWSDGVEWHPVGGACLTSAFWDLFMTKGQVWLAWSDGQEVSWGPIGP